MQTFWGDQESITIKTFKMGVSGLEETSGDNNGAHLLCNAHPNALGGTVDENAKE